MTRTFKAQAVATMMNTTPDTVRRITDESGIDVLRQETGPRTRIYSPENIYDIANWRYQKKGEKRAKRKVVATIYVPKGGVGKSTAAANWSCIFPMMGVSCLPIDLDFQGNLTLAMGYDSELSLEEALEAGLSPERVVENHFGSLFDKWPVKQPLDKVIKKPFGEFGPHLIPADVTLDTLDTLMTYEQLEARDPMTMFARMIHEGRSQKNPNLDLSPYDVILFDAAPAKNRMTRSALLASDYVIAPISLEKYSTKAVSYLSNVLSELKEQYGRAPELIIVGNFFDQNRTRVMNQTSKIRQTYNDAWLSSVIRRSEDFPKTLSSDDFELPLCLSKPSSAGAEDMRRVASDLLQRMGVL